jgi:hypothetical protein
MSEHGRGVRVTWSTLHIDHSVSRANAVPNGRNQSPHRMPTAQSDERGSQRKLLIVSEKTRGGHVQRPGSKPDEAPY